MSKFNVVMSSAIHTEECCVVEASDEKDALIEFATSPERQTFSYPSESRITVVQLNDQIEVENV